jgi:hypothetical protein
MPGSSVSLKRYWSALTLDPNDHALVTIEADAGVLATGVAAKAAIKETMHISPIRRRLRPLRPDLMDATMRITP